MPELGVRMSGDLSLGILGEVAAYYGEKFSTYGETPLGVDWNGVEGQLLRFRQIASLWGSAKSYSVFDLGCGYGAFKVFLRQSDSEVRYLGIDVAEEMICAARKGQDDLSRFLVGSKPDEVCDYGVASGIFNVKLGQPEEVWKRYIFDTLDVMNTFSERGFAFNCLTAYSDSARMKPHLFYADPCAMFDLCKRKYSRNVALLHDYGLFEFTILVRKDV